MKPWERFSDLVQATATAGQRRALELTAQGIMPCLYLYFTPAAKADGGLVLVHDTDPAPEGHQLATPEGLRCNVPYSNYYKWIRERAMRLPILGGE
jgi:hypothetical protein